MRAARGDGWGKWSTESFCNKRKGFRFSVLPASPFASACRGGRDGTGEKTFELTVGSETSPLVVLGDFKDWMALAFVRQILMFDKFAPGILAVIKGRATGAEAYLACMKDGEEQSEDSPPEPIVLDVIEHKFDQPRDAESDLRRRRRRGR